MVATKPISMASFYFGKFKPHLVDNTQLYIQRKDSTVSLCPDYSVNGYDFTQAVALQQPTLGVDSIDFTTNDFMINNTANAFSGDTSGYIFFSGYFNSAASNFIIGSSDNATINFYFTIFILSTGILRYQARYNGASNQDTLDGNTVLTNGDFYYGWVRSDGSTITAKLNGVTQTFSVNSGGNNGRWFNDVPNRDNLTIGALIRSANAFGDSKTNKLYYNNGTISAIDIWKIEQFMSNPLNYI